jgi:type II secretory pathway pseudopilin PulG
MSLIANAKAKALKGNVSEAFKNEAGAIDLASIMVGIIVIGLIGGVIAATVFAVIPWAQDNAAKQQLDSVASAQAAYIGLSSDAGATTFGTAALLKSSNLFDATAANVYVSTSGSGTTSHYGAYKTSTSGKVFYITDKKTQPTGVATDVLAKSGAQTDAGATFTTWANS